MPVILILEDDANLRELIAESLEDEGYHVFAAANAAEALAVARKATLELVVADVRMEGMDGLACLDELRRLQPQVRRIVITGYADADAPTRAIRLEADDYVYKPFRMGTLLEVVSRVLRSRGEREGYESLLGRIVSGYRNLMEKAGTALVGVKLGSVERDRDQAFQNFFVAVRSGLLDRRQAAAVWERLEDLEQEREQLKASGLQLKERQDLLGGYRYVVDLLGAGSSVELTARTRLPEFGQLFRRIREGEVSAEQLKIAVFLRRLPPEERQGAPELDRLYLQVWGQ